MRDKRRIEDYMDNNLLNMDDLADVFAQLDSIEEEEAPLTEEEKASQRRYEEIIKKHKNNQYKLYPVSRTRWVQFFTQFLSCQ